jgi:hypothetical protein
MKAVCTSTNATGLFRLIRSAHARSDRNFFRLFPHADARNINPRHKRISFGHRGLSFACLIAYNDIMTRVLTGVDGGGHLSLSITKGSYCHA